MNLVNRELNALIQRQRRFIQSENSKLQYQVSWGAILGTDTIAASEWESVGNSATIETETIVGGGTFAYISGSPGEYTIVNKITTTTSGEIMERILKIKITDNDEPKLTGDYPED